MNNIMRPLAQAGDIVTAAAFSELFDSPDSFEIRSNIPDDAAPSSSYNPYLFLGGVSINIQGRYNGGRIAAVPFLLDPGVSPSQTIEAFANEYAGYYEELKELSYGLLLNMLGNEVAEEVLTSTGRTLNRKGTLLLGGLAVYNTKADGSGDFFSEEVTSTNLLEKVKVALGVRGVAHGVQRPSLRDRILGIQRPQNEELVARRVLGRFLDTSPEEFRELMNRLGLVMSRESYLAMDSGLSYRASLN